MMNATKFVKLKRNFPKLRPTAKRNLKVDKLHKIQKVSEQICSEMILIHILEPTRSRKFQKKSAARCIRIGFHLSNYVLE